MISSICRCTDGRTDRPSPGRAAFQAIFSLHSSAAAAAAAGARNVLARSTLDFFISPAWETEEETVSISLSKLIRPISRLKKMQLLEHFSK